MKYMNHTEYPKLLKKKSKEVLRYIIKDCNEALEALPEGENSHYYMDEICYCDMELKRRR